MFKMLGLFNKQQTGFSLVELLVAMVVVAVLGTAIAMTYSQVIGSNSGVTNRQNAIKQVQYVVDSISRDAVQATSISGNSTTLSLTIPIPVTAGGVLTTQNTTAQYTLTNNTLVRVSGSTTTKVASNITTLSETKIKPNSGPVATSINVMGTGWVASDTISSVTLGGVTASYNLSVDANGNLSGTITVPSITNGAQTIVITGVTSGVWTFSNAFVVTTTPSSSEYSYYFTITANVGKAVETRVIQIIPRVSIP